MTLERKVRYITEQAALEYLEERGYGHLRPFEIVTGGLLGDAMVSRLFLADGLVWEFVEYPAGIRVYLYYVEDYTRSENGLSV